MADNPKVDLWDEDQTLVFRCPGCGNVHALNVKCPERPRWDWNGSLASPTLHPSILVRWEFRDGTPYKTCHSFVRDGSIQFLNDCTHALAGKTVPLPDWNEDD